MGAFDSTIWIVHREPGPRGALARIAGSVRGRHQIVMGRAGDSVFDATTPADLVVLDLTGIPGDPEPELDLARRVERGNPHCAWILIIEPGELEPALRLFDSLDAQVIVGPPDARTLQPAVASALARSSALPLSQRLGRDHLSARFVRWFSSGEPKELALALDPRLALEPVLARGESGTGRGLLLRYVHVTSTIDPGPFLRVACGPEARADALIAQIEEGLHEAGRARGRFGIWLADVDRLPDAVQARVLDWLEFGPPAVLPTALRGNVRWFASAGEDPSRLSVGLALAFAELTIRTAPLRRRPEVIPAFVSDTARAWAAARREPAKDFEPRAIDLLRREPWPGNLAELEAVVIRSLAHADPRASGIGVDDLLLGPEVEFPPAPARAFRGEPGPQPRPSQPRPARPSPAPDEEAEPETPRALGQAGAGAETRAGEEPVVLLEPELEGEDLVDLAPIIDLELPPEPEPPADATPGAGARSESVARLARAVAHEVRNPLVSIRTFSDLLHDHYADEDFRDRFGRLVADDVRRIEQVVERLERMGESEEPAVSEPIDMTALLEGLLDDQRARIQAKRLLVLKELDRARPEALGDQEVLRTAIAELLGRAIDEIPERGDLYLASRHRAGSPDESPERDGMRIVLRYRVNESPGDSELALVTLRTTSLQTEVAEAMIQRQGGRLQVDTSGPAETVVVIDLPAPKRPR